MRTVDRLIARRYVAKRGLKFIAVAALAAVAVAVVALVYVVVQRGQALILPSPAGPYPVGRRITTWVDPSREEHLGGSPGQPRRLAVWVWYPAEPGGTPGPYMPADWARARETDRCCSRPLKG